MGSIDKRQQKGSHKGEESSYFIELESLLVFSFFGSLARARRPLIKVSQRRSSERSRCNNFWCFFFFYICHSGSTGGLLFETPRSPHMV